ncbi:ATP-dependent DNA ligase [Microbacterium sp. USHLN186]|uniref:ATP-dependent DNA ligase n=1 Tax=Microbacterium sp. USHLN186 TaxID=3081286 RepID=UPI0030190F67
MPAGLQPPLSVALARPASLSSANSLPGGPVYEPKWDGFRMLIVVDGAVSLWSRQGTDLTKRFPEIVAAADDHLPDGIILDGEAVIWRDDRLDFDALLRRMNSGTAAVARMARELPASYVAFDVLAVAHQDARALPFQDRRTLLEEVAVPWAPPMNLSPTTTKLEVAEQWFEALTASGIEGLVVKGVAQPYVGGQRDWMKVKHRDTIDVICGAVIGERARPSELVVGLPVNGELRIVGRTSSLDAQASRMLGKILSPPLGEHPWPSEVKPGAVDRFNRSRRDTVPLTLVEPMVVEISADVAMTGYSFRHVVRLLRPRPELDPAELPGWSGEGTATLG